MRKQFYIILITLFSLPLYSQSEPYEAAYNKLVCMLEGECPVSFKQAVFEVENAYYQNTLDSVIFNDEIDKLVSLANKLVESRELTYEGRDKAEVEKFAAIFSVMKDSIPIKDGEGNTFYWNPYTYDFNDVWGHGDWSNMFVSKLLMTRKGNCHSLPYLYKILAEKMDVEAHLALAPNHIYIKHRNEKDGWYNTELTSGIFPIDAWLMASGYIHLDAIANKMYMEALDDKQSLAMCLVDLAQGYNRTHLANDGTFALKCTTQALKYYPHYVNGLILNAEIKKRLLEQFADKNYLVLESDDSMVQEFKSMYLTLQDDYVAIHKLGYRKMPEKMYLDWLVSLQEERNKFENKELKNN